MNLSIHIGMILSTFDLKPSWFCFWASPLKGLMQNQYIISNHVINVLKRQVLRAQGKKIKDVLNILIQSFRRIWTHLGCFIDYDDAKLFTFLFVYLFFIYFP